jgi:hypothetical protein
LVEREEISRGLAGNESLCEIAHRLTTGNADNGLDFRGGGIDNKGTLTVTDTTISENFTAGAGGGIYNYGILLVNGSSVITANTAIATNTTPGTGGGIYNTGDITIVPPATVTGNTPDDCFGC